MASTPVEPVLVSGLALFVSSCTFDLMLTWWGKPVTATILDNVGMGIFGALAVRFYLRASLEHHNFERAKERIGLVSEVNRQVREVFGEMAETAMLEDRSERLQRVDEITDRMDSVLGGLAPLSPNGGKARSATPEKDKRRTTSSR